jgi:transposase
MAPFWRISACKGPANGRSKLEPDDVRAIRVLLIDGRSNSQIAEMFSIHKNTVQSIRNGTNWGWLV